MASQNRQGLSGFFRNGSMKVDFYNDSLYILKSRVVMAGDVISFCYGAWF